jgi:peptidyl-prolyl cis-trans isomerase D
MTMLDGMRRHKGWLKWSLVIVLASFVYFYVPSCYRSAGAGGAPTDSLASVNGRNVLVSTYRRMYQQQVQSLRSAYGGSFDEQMLKQFGVGERLIQQLVDEEAVLAEADRLGITVSNAELAERLQRVPGFQENGRFIGEARYRELLQMQRPPITTAEFEEQLRSELITEKVQAAVTGWLRVSEVEVDAEYRKRNEKVKLDLAMFTANKFRAGIQPTDPEIAAQFAAHQDAYQSGEKRRVRFLSIDADALKAKMAVAPAELAARYQSNISTYSTPEQLRASQILFKTEGKDEAAVKTLAESVLAKVKAGGDFAALARQHSDDDASKKNGGDLDYFGRGTMPKEVEDAVWALSPGQVSGVVKSPAGLYIVKVVDKKAASTRPLADVRPQVEDQIRGEKARAEATKLATEIAAEIKEPGDLDRVARARGLVVGDSGLFAREEPLAGLGFAPEVTNEAFTMAQGKVSGQLRTNQGFAFISLVEVRPPAPPKLDEVKDKVREDVIRLKAIDVAKAKSIAFAQAAAKGNFAAAAKAAGVDVKSTEFVARNSAYPEIGVNGAVDDAVFALKAGDSTPPITTDTAVVVARVKERQDPDPAKAAADRDSLRGELLQQQRGQFFAAYMTKAKVKMTITYNENAIRALLGG